MYPISSLNRLGSGPVFNDRHNAPNACQPSSTLGRKEKVEEPASKYGPCFGINSFDFGGCKLWVQKKSFEVPSEQISQGLSHWRSDSQGVQVSPRHVHRECYTQKNVAHPQSWRLHFQTPHRSSPHKSSLVKGNKQLPNFSQDMEQKSKSHELTTKDRPWKMRGETSLQGFLPSAAQRWICG